MLKGEWIIGDRRVTGERLPRAPIPTARLLAPCRTRHLELERLRGFWPTCWLLIVPGCQPALCTSERDGLLHSWTRTGRRLR